MSPAIKKFLQSWVINTLAVLVVTQIVRGIHYDSTTGLIVATLVLGILNAFPRPVLLFVLFLSVQFLILPLCVIGIILSVFRAVTGIGRTRRGRRRQTTRSGDRISDRIYYRTARAACAAFVRRQTT